jgi:hypothetical protein
MHLDHPEQRKVSEGLNRQVREATGTESIWHSVDGDVATARRAES